MKAGSWLAIRSNYGASGNLRLRRESNKLACRHHRGRRCVDHLPQTESVLKTGPVLQQFQIIPDDVANSAVTLRNAMGQDNKITGSLAAAEFEQPPSRQIPMVGQRIDSRQLFAEGREITILHGQDSYRLRLTAQNKLILTK